MTLDAAARMRRSTSLKQRIESAAYAQGQSMQWVDRNLSVICSDPTWATKWMQARSDAFDVGDENRDIGILNNVIDDEMIDTAVTAAIDNDPASTAPAPDPAAFAALQQQVAAMQQQLAELTAAPPATGETPA